VGTVKPARLSAGDLLALAASVLSRGGHLDIRVDGHSMRPFLSPDDCVTLGPLAPGGLSLGEVLLADTPDGARLHRVVGEGSDVDGRYLLLRGDAETGSGTLVRPVAIIGRVVSVRRGLRSWIRWFKSKIR
jgi:hypothetical protein